MNATSARPTVSAPAVTAVRAGLRLLFSRASMPAGSGDRLERPSERGGERRDEPPRDEREAHEQNRRPARHQEQPHGRGQAAREQSNAEQGGAGLEAQVGLGKLGLSLASPKKILYEKKGQTHDPGCPQV